MDPRQRLMAILNKDNEVDRVSWSPLIDGYYLSSFNGNKDIIEAFIDIDADVMERHVLTWESNLTVVRPVAGSDRGNIIDFTENGVRVIRELEKVERGTLLTIKYEINGYVLTSKHIYNKESPFIPFPLEYFIKTAEDIDPYIEVKKRERYSERFKDFIKEDKRIGDMGIATDSSPTSPIQQVIQHLTGIEKFYTLFFTEHLNELEKLMDVMHEKNIEAYRLIARSPAQVVIGYENTSTTLVSPEIYEKYSLHQIDDYADILHKAGKIYLTHRCGKLKGLAGFLKKGKDDGIIDISPGPTGDLDIWDAREIWQDKIVQGGIDPTSLSHWPVERLKDYVEGILDKTGNGNRLIIGTADATPQDAKLENLKAVGEVLKKKRL